MALIVVPVVLACLGPVPSPAPTAAPTLPTAASTPSGGPVRFTVPAVIDATCATDASPALNAWIAERTDGSTLVFPPGSCYKLGGDMGLNLKNRNGLTLVGTGSTLHLRTSGIGTDSSAFFMQNSTHITIRGFAVDGGNPLTGTVDADTVINERISAAMIYAGSRFIEFDRVSWDRLYGFGILIASNEGTLWPESIYVHDSTIRGAECGLCVVAGRRIRFIRNTVVDSVGSAVDLEPDSHSAGPNGEPGFGGGFEDVLIADNDITRFGWIQTSTTWFVALVPQRNVLDTAFMDGLTVTGNRIHVGAATEDNGNADGIGGLGIRGDTPNLKRNITITDNWTGDDDTRQAGRFVMNLRNVENLTVTGNRQPIDSGRLLRDVDTSGDRTVNDNDVSP